ncbi:hypothetical protein AAG906_021551 [Vitis piasezkii]
MMFKDTSQDREAQPSMSLNKICSWNKKQSDSEGVMRWDQFKSMPLAEPNGNGGFLTLDATRAELALVILYLNKAEARDKICRAIQYGLKFWSDGQPGTAQNVDKSTSLARKVFHLFFNNLLVLFVFLSIVFVALQNALLSTFLLLDQISQRIVTQLSPQFCNGHGTSDDVKEKKPDPSIYQTTVKRLGVSEKDCLVVEDSVTGLQALLYNTVELLLYAPTRPVVFLWMMAVGTVVCAALWPEYIACEQNDERYNELSPKAFEAGATKDDQGKEVLDISEKGVVAKCKTSSNACLTSLAGSSTPTPLVSSFDFVNSDLSAWCFSCDAYLDAQAILQLHPVYETTYILKFGQAPPFPTTDNQAEASTYAIKFQHGTLDL